MINQIESFNMHVLVIQYIHDEMSSIFILVFGRKYFHHLTTVSEPLNKTLYGTKLQSRISWYTKSDIVI